MSSAMATLNNWTVSRRFPGLPYDMSPDTPLDIYVRVTCYRLVAKLFYYQSLVFWSLLVLLIGALFWWSLNNGQFDDLEAPARRILDDDE